MEKQKTDPFQQQNASRSMCGTGRLFWLGCYGSAHYLFICHGFHSLFGHYCLYILWIVMPEKKYT